MTTREPVTLTFSRSEAEHMARLLRDDAERAKASGNPLLAEADLRSALRIDGFTIAQAARPDGDVTITTQMRRHEAHRAAAALLVSDDEALLSIGRAISGALMTEQPAAAHARPGGEEASR